MGQSICLKTSLSPDPLGDKKHSHAPQLAYTLNLKPYIMCTNIPKLATKHSSFRQFDQDTQASNQHHCLVDEAQNLGAMYGIHGDIRLKAEIRAPLNNDPTIHPEHLDSEALSPYIIS